MQALVDAINNPDCWKPWVGPAYSLDYGYGVVDGGSTEYKVVTRNLQTRACEQCSQMYSCH